MVVEWDCVVVAAAAAADSARPSGDTGSKWR